MRERYLVRNEACPPCMMQCVKHNRVPDGPHEGLEIDGPEYETIYVFGGLCEIVDFGEVMYLNDICDRLGVDTMTAGNLCALAIEASRRGLIDLGLDFGDAEGVADFLESMCRRDTRLGDLFADGVLRVEKELGLEGVAVHVKGMEPAGYDPRCLKGMGLAFVTTARGACHLRGTFYKAELAGFIDPQTTEGKAAMYVDWEDRLCVMDTLIYCRFYRDLVPWPYITQVVNAAIGTDYSSDDLHGVAGRIITETHRFNELRGFTARRQGAAAGLDHRAGDRRRAAAAVGTRTRWTSCCATTTRCAAGARRLSDRRPLGARARTDGRSLPGSGDGGHGLERPGDVGRGREAAGAEAHRALLGGAQVLVDERGAVQTGAHGDPVVGIEDRAHVDGRDPCDVAGHDRHVLVARQGAVDGDAGQGRQTLAQPS